METNNAEETKPQEVIVIEEKTKTALSSVEQNNKDAILMIHENMEGLIRQANELDIDINSKESYDKAIELKRLIKSTHIQVEKRRKELKAPFIEAGKKLDEFVKGIYNPLKEAEQLVKGKCEVYEKEQDRIKEEKKEEEQNALKAEEEMNGKLQNLNGYLEKINNAKSQEQIAEIEQYLETVNPNDFGDKSSDAGFIITQLKMTCNMAKKVLPEIAPPENLVKQEFPTKEEEKPEPIVSKEVVEKVRSGVPSEPIVKIEGDKMVVPKGTFTEMKPEQKEHLDMHEKRPSTKNGELDFETVADENQTNILDQIAEQEEKQVEENGSMLEFDMPKKQQYLTPEQTNEHLGNSVLPTAIYEGTDEKKVVEVQFVDSVRLKPRDESEEVIITNGLPYGITIQSVKPNGDVVIGQYIFQNITTQLSPNN